MARVLPDAIRFRIFAFSYGIYTRMQIPAFARPLGEFFRSMR